MNLDHLTACYFARLSERYQKAFNESIEDAPLYELDAINYYANLLALRHIRIFGLDI